MFLYFNLFKFSSALNPSKFYLASVQKISLKKGESLFRIAYYSLNLSYSISGVRAEIIGTDLLRPTSSHRRTADPIASVLHFKVYNRPQSRELGERIIEAAVNYIVEFIEEFRKVEIPPTF